MHCGRDASSPLRVLLVVSNLEYGGAQRQIVTLANAGMRAGLNCHILSLSEFTPLACELDDPSRLHVIKKRWKFDFSVVGKIAKLIDRLDIQIAHSFLFDADIAVRLAGRKRTGVAVFGSERNSDHVYKWRQSLALRLTSKMFDGIIANSEAGKRFQMRRLGIPADHMFVVHNGVDTERFSPVQSKEIQQELHIALHAPVVGMFCSFKRQKNHAMFFRMAKIVAERIPEARFICVGDELHGGLEGTTGYRKEMIDYATSLGVIDKLHFLGNRDNMPPLYCMCQVTVLTSSREGTPNVILESLACGVPVVATDVADNAIILPQGEAGFTVDYDDEHAMAKHVMSLLENQATRAALGLRARKHVEENYSTVRLAEKTADVYWQVYAALGATTQRVANRC
jgi:glycosyltransferase involved in cell wall biosynthesis